MFNNHYVIIITATILQGTKFSRRRHQVDEPAIFLGAFDQRTPDQ